MKFFINATSYIYIHTEPLIIYFTYIQHRQKKSLSLVSIFFVKMTWIIVDFFMFFFEKSIIFDYSLLDDASLGPLCKRDACHEKSALFNICTFNTGNPSFFLY